MLAALVCVFLCGIEIVTADVYAVKLQNTTTVFALQFAAKHRLKLLHLDPVAGYHVFKSVDKAVKTTHTLKKLGESPHVLEVEKQVLRQQYKRSNDPLRTQQWHLDAIEVSSKYSGKNINIAIVDDGLQWEHPDLKLHYAARLSHDFNDKDADPTPTYAEDGHGTSAGGVCCAIKDNRHCGQGVAYNSNVAGIRLIARGTYDYEEAQGLTFKNDQIHIYSCSWGPQDSGEDMVGPGRVTTNALTEAFLHQNSIFIWAGGNGKGANDNSNYDGYANHFATFAIGAINYDGKQSYYSENGANLLAVTPSSGSYRKGITTIDLLGQNGYSPGECTSTFGGTSSSAPLAAGIVAIMLEKKPTLKNRDVMHIIAKHASKVDITDPEWKTLVNPVYSHSHRYGFGMLSIPRLLAGIDLHSHLVPPMKTVACRQQNFNVFIPASRTMYLTYNCQNDATLQFVEQVLVTLTWMHRKHGQTKFTFSHSDPAVESVLADSRPDIGSGTKTWTFSTYRCFGDSLKRSDTFRVGVADLINDAYKGRLLSMQVKVLGF